MKAVIINDCIFKEGQIGIQHRIQNQALGEQLEYYDIIIQDLTVEWAVDYIYILLGLQIWPLYDARISSFLSITDVDSDQVFLLYPGISVRLKEGDYVYLFSSVDESVTLIEMTFAGDKLSEGYVSAINFGDNVIRTMRLKEVRRLNPLDSVSVNFINKVDGLINSIVANPDSNKIY